MKHLFYIISITLSILSSCGSEPQENYSKANVEVDSKNEVQKKECQLLTMNFKLRDTDRTLQFEYKNGKLAKIETIEDGKDINQTMAFNFNEHGGIQTFFSGSVIASYIYDDDHNILSVKGEKSLNTRNFSYNEKGQIETQETIFGKKVYLVHKYKYDANGQPVTVFIYDKFGDLIEENQIKYDDKINPFVNKGSLVNSMEMLLGYPVGNQGHNILEINKTYKKKTSYKINGEFKEEGDSETNKIEYKYNEDDYPIEIGRMRNGEKTTMTLTYDCL